jgi:drug/metabolite transporter (DMT)-like permease
MSLTTIEHKRNAAAGGAALAATAGLAWGAMFPVAKHGLRHVDAFHMTSIRYGLASLAFLALLAAREGRQAIRLEGRGLRLLVLGSLGFAGFNLLTYVGLGSTRPQNAALMIATMPFLTLLVLWVRDGARVAPRKLSWNTAVQRLGAPTAVPFTNLVPITAFVIAIAGGYAPNAYELGGAALAIVSLAAVTLLNRASAPAPAGSPARLARVEPGLVAAASSP